MEVCVSQDWGAVADAINTRLAELGMRQVELSAKSGVATATLRLIQKGVAARRSPRTLVAISEALGWPARHLEDIAAGAETTSGDRIAWLEKQVTDLRERVERIEAT